jgi:DNA repair protein RadC
MKKGKTRVLSSNPSNHMVAHNHPQWDLMPSSGVPEDSYSVLTENNK